VAQELRDDVSGGAGGADAGDIEQCVEREIKEELGVEIEVGPHYISMEVKRQHGKFELCFYFARIIGPYTALKCIECSAWEWIFIDQIKATRDFYNPDILAALEIDYFSPRLLPFVRLA